VGHRIGGVRLTPTLTLPLGGLGNLAPSPYEGEGWGEGGYPIKNLNHNKSGPI